MRFEQQPQNPNSTATASPQPVSLWHHLALRPSSSSNSTPHIVTFVNEIPRGQREKLELSTKQPWNPIVQDRNKKTGALRCFTYGDLPFHYGFLPQTWEDPSLRHHETGCVGDGDPLDVVDLSPCDRHVGDIVSVKLLGVLALIDEGETDWKLITVDVGSDWRSLKDVPSSTLEAVTRWFRYYKTTDGKPENQFAFGGEVKGEQEALEVVAECSGQYQALLAKTATNPGLWLP